MRPGFGAAIAGSVPRPTRAHSANPTDPTPPTPPESASQIRKQGPAPERCARRRTIVSLRNTEICIVGGGMSGLLMGIRLKEAGIESFRIYEKAPSLGGTW